jgi:hypothetical protein
LLLVTCFYFRGSSSCCFPLTIRQCIPLTADADQFRRSSATGCVKCTYCLRRCLLLHC